MKKIEANCHDLGIQVSPKLERILESQRRIEEQILAVKSDPNQQGFSNTSIESLQERMSKASLSQHHIAKEQAIIGSLNFRRRPVRHSAITEAHQKTFRWIFEDEADSRSGPNIGFADWLRRGRQSFWISGKPGSGKSTLMKYIVGERRTAESLSAWSAPQKVVIASHFFWNAGNEMQKSQQGLLQSLLHDIFRQCPDLIERCCTKRWERVAGKEGAQDDLESWSCAELHKTLRRVADGTKHQSPVKFCIFIDGLDEYDGDHYELCETIRDLGQSASIKLCVSSRPWNVFVEAFGESSAKLAVHELTRGDIEKFSTDRLESHPRWRSIATNPSRAQQLIGEITERASGVFLWVFLVTKKLREGLTNYDTFSELLRRLESFPVELDAFFRHILKSVDGAYHGVMATSLQITIAAANPLDIKIYAFHDLSHEDKDYVAKQPLEPFSPQEVEDTGHLIPRLNCRSGGLLEVNSDRCVTFLHRTVRDFLETREMSDFLVAAAPPGFSPTLCLLETHVAAMKRSGYLSQVARLRYILHVMLQEVSVYAERLEKEAVTDQTAEAYYNALAELERCMTSFVGQPRFEDIYERPRERPCLFKQFVLGFKLAGYLQRKLAEDPLYIGYLDGWTMRSIFGTLESRNFCGGGVCLNYILPELPSRWLKTALEVVQQILHSRPDININERDPTSEHSPLTFLIFHSAIPNLGSGNMLACWRAGERFWSLLETGALSFFLEQGADPNTAGIFTPFQIYLFISLSLVPKNTRQKDLYIHGLRKFLKAGANLNTILPNASCSNATSFFEALREPRWRSDPNLITSLNVPLLGEVIETLLTHAKVTGLTFPMGLVWDAVDRVLPEARARHLKVKFQDLAEISIQTPPHHRHGHGDSKEMGSGFRPPKRKADPGFADWTSGNSDNSDTQEGRGSRKKAKIVSSTSPCPASKDSKVKPFLPRI